MIKFLHTRIRIGDLDRTIVFYVGNPRFQAEPPHRQVARP
jgi:hypothetical protein